MPVEVRPTEFSMVFFDAAEIQGIVEKLVAEIGLPADLERHGRDRRDHPDGPRPRGVGRPVVITAESGALEDVKAPRQLSEAGHARRARQAPVLRARPARPRLRRPAGRRRPHASRSRWPGRCTASAGSAGSATRCSASAASTSSATATASPMPPTPRSTRLWTADDLTWADIAAISQEALAALPGVAYFRSWAEIGSRRSIVGRAGEQPRAALGHRDHVGRVEVGLLVLGPLPLLHDHEAVRLGGGHGQVDVAAPGWPRLSTT